MESKNTFEFTMSDDEEKPVVENLKMEKDTKDDYDARIANRWRQY